MRAWGFVVLAACGSPAAHPIDGAVAIDASTVHDAPSSDGPGSDAPPAAAQLVAAPALDDFMAVDLGCTSAMHAFAITNTGSTASGALTTSLTGSDAGSFHIATDGCAGQDLAPGASCTVDVRFAPTFPGARAAALVVAGTAVTVSVSLVGTGLAAAPLSISPSFVDFGVVAPGTTSAPRTITISEQPGCPGTGPVAATLSGIDTGSFAIANDTCTGTSIMGGTSCTLGVTYTAKPSGTSTASVTVRASPGPQVTAGLQGE
jgi:hypothetical protein